MIKLYVENPTGISQGAVTAIEDQVALGFYIDALQVSELGIILLFLDEPHLRSIATALWDGAPHGKASVMIGAGFSRNALPTSSTLPATKLFPGWGELTENMAKELYAGPNDRALLAKAIQSASSTSGALRIADEYQAWKGRGKLDALLRKAIPDEKFRPGPLHNLLFKLPWADILTTNFDTLLERAAAEEIDRRYTVVRSQHDIPGSLKPRIVKLHGSFPDTKPFIITEDDFRTYEQVNPIMVNLVQQSFVENTCCLIGFSGDDPNFLKWTGWVRDILSPTHMEPVYLVGILNHTPARRALLERRHVRSIDLAPLFSEKQWPDPDIRHRAATDWFLRALLQLRPPAFHNWPSSTAFEVAAPLFKNSPDLPVAEEDNLRIEYDHPVHIAAPDEAEGLSLSDYQELSEDEQLAVSQQQLHTLNSRGEGQLLTYRIDTITEVWKYNRLRFPGWLILPWANRKSLEYFTLGWVDPIAKAVPDVNTQRAMGWLYELQWRLERCLVSWPDTMIAAVEKILGSEPLEKLAGEATTGGIAATLAAQLIRAHRENGNRIAFKNWTLKIQNVVNERSEDGAFCVHQNALAALEEWRIEAAQTMLLNWNVDGLDPIWRARRAALLGELDHSSAGEQALQALKEIQGIGEPNDIAARTREAAALWLASVLSPMMSEERRKLDVRREELQRKGFTSNWLAERLGSLVAGSPVDVISVPARVKHHEPTQVEAAFIARRFIEDSASLIRKPGLVADELASALVPWMAVSSPIAALRLSLRNRDHGNRTHLLSCDMLAKIGPSELLPVFEGLTESIAALGSRIGRHANEPQYSRLTSGVEHHTPAEGANWLLQVALSHLRDISFLLDETQLSHAVEACFDLRINWQGGQWQTWNYIEETTSALLRQCSNDIIRDLLPEIVLQPIIGLDMKSISPLNRSDMLSDAILRTQVQQAGDVTLPADRIDLLFTQLDDDLDLSTKARIIMRLAAAWNWSALNAADIVRLSSGVEKILRERERLDEGEKLDYFLSEQELLFLPETRKGSFRALIPKGLAASEWSPLITRNEDGSIRSIKMGVGANDPITMAAGLTRDPWINKNWQLSSDDWTKDQVVSLLQKAEDWLRSEGIELLERQKSEDITFGRYDQRAVKTVEFCRKVALPKAHDSDIAHGACSVLQLLNENGVETLSAVGVLLVARPEYLVADAANNMRRAASSLKPSSSIAFLVGLLNWLSQAKSEALPAPPEDLIHEVGVAVRGRRAPDLKWALHTAQVILKQFSCFADERFRRDISVGLQYLAAETDVTAPTLNVREQQGDLKEIREACVNLVRALQPFKEGTDVIDVWLRNAEVETVREIKQAYGRLSQAGNTFN
jgi:hypothetical protein